MEIVIKGLILLIALEHLAFLVLEMFFWTKKSGRKIFNNSLEKAEQTKVLAANQGLYNGFLAVGLIFSLLYPKPEVGSHISLFFLSCIFVAGVYGVYSVNKIIFFIQGLPALIAIVLILFESTLFLI